MPAYRSALDRAVRRDLATAVAALTLVVLLLFAGLYPSLAVHNPADPAAYSLADALRPPVWRDQGTWAFPCGSDDQGRDLLALTAVALRVSLALACGAVLVAFALGLPVGVISGYCGGVFDTILMRLADLQMTYPAVLTAILLDGISRTVLAPAEHAAIAVPLVLAAIGLSFWVQIARAVRSLVAVERLKDYVSAAKLGGVPTRAILSRHIVPAMAPALLVLATVDVAAAVATEATLGFLGLGLPSALPSLGGLIRNGAAYLFSGAWWLVAVPVAALFAVIAAISTIADGLVPNDEPLP
jgi:peptide/nickel transport system permease protein